VCKKGAEGRQEAQRRTQDARAREHGWRRGHGPGLVFADEGHIERVDKVKDHASCGDASDEGRQVLDGAAAHGDDEVELVIVLEGLDKEVELGALHAGLRGQCERPRDVACGVESKADGHIVAAHVGPCVGVNVACAVLVAHAPEADGRVGADKGDLDTGVDPLGAAVSDGKVGWREARSGSGN
jgi:hypothetical protein